jgi:aminoglycoside phosphotransferase (APT) family kinase protein
VSNLAYPAGAGYSNETILFRAHIADADTVSVEDLVLRVSPGPRNQLFLDVAIDAQALLQQTLRQHDLVRVPNIRWYEADPSWLGRPFFVMDRARGQVPVSTPVYNASGWLFDATPAQRRTMWESAMAELVRIHRVPSDLVRFLPGGTGPTPGFEQSVEYARRHYRWAIEGVAHPIVDRLWGWLDTNLPPAPPQGLSWGDARIGNMMFSDEYRVVVVMDWEQASLGGPLLDLGWWLLRDATEGEQFARLEGLGSRQETIDLWEDGLGLGVGHLLWYEVFAAVRHATLVIRSTNMLGRLPKDEGHDVNSYTRRAYALLGWDLATA